jgi:hypothetical protein
MILPVLHLYVRLLPLAYLTVAQKVIPFQYASAILFCLSIVQLSCLASPPSKSGQLRVCSCPTWPEVVRFNRLMA